MSIQFLLVWYSQEDRELSAEAIIRRARPLTAGQNIVLMPGALRLAPGLDRKDLMPNMQVAKLAKVHPLGGGPETALDRLEVVREWMAHRLDISARVFVRDEKGDWPLGVFAQRQHGSCAVLVSEIRSTVRKLKRLPGDARVQRIREHLQDVIRQHDVAE